MKNLLFILLFCLTAPMISQVQATAPKAKEVTSKVKAATVFLSGAQVSRSAKVVLEKGTTILKFVEISTKIDKESLQVDGEGDFTILSVQHQMKKRPEEKVENAAIEGFQKQIKELQEKIKDEQAMVSVYTEELNLIMAHRNFNHPKEGIKIGDLQQAADFFRSRLKEIKLSQLQHNRTIAAHREAINELAKKIREITTKRKPFKPASEVYVTVNAKKPLTVDFKISYLVPQAAWYPSYDLRVKDVNSPIELAYKATVFQLTDEDWEEAKLTLSTGNPSQSGSKPNLQIWQLGYTNPYAYRNRQPVYKNTPQSTIGATGQMRTLSGRLTDASGQPLIGANVMVQGTAIGTSTDVNGYYSLQGAFTPSNVVTFSYTGYTSQQQQIGNRYSLNIALSEGATLDEVVVTGYSSKEKARRAQKYKDSKKRAESVEKPTTATTISSTPVAVTQTDRTMSVTFEIDLPYTIPSNGEEYTVAIQQLDIPAEYQHSCVPKLDLSVYLTAKITDWENYSLLNGNVNLFFEGTFLNKSYLDLTSAKDTLEISLGRDKEILVKRTKIKNSSKRQFIGSDKMDARTWEIEVENRKRQSINLIIEDQIPVVHPQHKETVEVSLKKDGGGKLNKETGKLEWKLKMGAKAKKKLEFKYEVKYPKTMNLVLE